jgi:peptidoglycan/LPS O-acetylase OafA/YrhL
MNAPTHQPDARVPALDGVRGLAILLVVVMHALFFGVPLPGVAPPTQLEPYVLLAGLGWCGVDVFFVLSGYLITGILVRSRGEPHYFRNFYVRRALRIFPLYYVVMALLLWWLPRAAATGSETAAYLLYYQNFRLAFGVDVQTDLAREITWSLAVEEQFYLVWPAVIAFVPRRWLPRVCVVAILGAIAARFVCLESGIPKPYFLTFCRLDALAAGALLALVPLPPKWFGALAASLGAGALVGIAWHRKDAFPATAVMQSWGLIAAMAMAVGVLVLARHAGVIARLLTLAPLRSLGAYSYCIYLVHFLVIEWMAFRWHGDLPVALQRWLAATLSPVQLLLVFTATCLVASWAVAWLSWHLFEQRVLRWKRHFPSISDRSAP